MGSQKKAFHTNLRADHSDVNQNQLSRAVTSASVTRTPSAQGVIENFIVVNEADLPFIPDTIESMITLLDLMIGIYRSIAHSLDESGTMSRTELTDIDLALSSVEVVLRRTIITDGLAALDAEYLKRKIPRSKDLLEKDIIRVSSQPNANNPKQSPQYLQSMATRAPAVVMPQSQAMYV